MGAEPPGHGHGIDESGEGRTARQGEIIALGPPGPGDALGRHAHNLPGQGWRAQPRRIDEEHRAQPHGLGSARLDLDTPRRHAPAQHGGLANQGRPMGLRIAQQAQHIGVAVDDAGGGGEEGADAGERGLQSLRLHRAQQLHILHAIDGGPRADACELLQLRRIGRHDQLAAAPVRQAALAEIFVERPAALHAEAGHEAAMGIIDARVDDLAVAGGCFRAEALGLVEDQHLASGDGERAGDSQPHHARARDDAINLFQAGLPWFRASPSSRRGSRPWPGGSRPGCS